jgi:putative NADPH-quinone reductase
MKTLMKIFLTGVLFTGILWSCSKSDQVPGNLTLKQSLNQSAANLKNAVSQIKASSAYGILTAGATKAAVVDSNYKVNINLDLIKGIFDYKPGVRPDSRGYPVLHFFTKTGENNHMIVRMPLQKAKYPWTLRKWTPADSTLANNFIIDVSDYHNNYNNRWDFDYLLSAAIDTNSVEAGKLNIQSKVGPSTGVHYSSQFAFTKSYTAQYTYASGDTTLSRFDITGNGKTLYEEKLMTIRNDTAMFGREFQYILTIGNVQFKRNSNSDSTQVFVNGVFQPNARIKVVDATTDAEPSVVKKRDIQVTFQDGTTTTISALIGSSIADLRNLYLSLHSVYFAANVVDWIAYDIYYQR